MKTTALALVPLLIALAIPLAGCGQKGPLYLPGENPNPPRSLLDDPNADSSSANQSSSPAAPEAPDAETQTTSASDDRS
ncbi:lipoprotein [Salinisphaera sp. Q1T1-3]|uniref:LPS translocon maturation chaperone LptM n=1 Tax=Salinisphaera sp. Q1T1-3 TaxID=2321229 RepID=UPI000E7432A4|nr:lipoprotein [Salinisphaera sp. Q1T1-3]RJS92547.1 hypothetical protein D3260_11540 [Salinisphaera sp. Q1T1-3]